MATFIKKSAFAFQLNFNHRQMSQQTAIKTKPPPNNMVHGGNKADMQSRLSLLKSSTGAAFIQPWR